MLVVRKYGGSCFKQIEDFQIIAEKIKEGSSNGERIIVVVSAPYGFTDLLSSRITTLCLSSCENNCHAVKEQNKLLAIGEQISASQLSLALNNIGIKAQSYDAMSLGLRCNSEKNSITKIDNHNLISSSLAQEIVPIITGFQAIDENNQFVILPRNSSDMTAVCLADLLDVDECRLYKDIDGIYDIDPELSNKAKKLAQVSIRNAFKIAEAGAAVVSINALQYLIDHYISTIVCHYDERSSGSKILPTRDISRKNAYFKKYDNNFKENFYGTL